MTVRILRIKASLRNNNKRTMPLGQVAFSYLPVTRGYSVEMFLSARLEMILSREDKGLACVFGE